MGPKQQNRGGHWLSGLSLRPLLYSCRRWLACRGNAGGIRDTRYFFHSFPRGKANEPHDDILARGLKILAFMKEVGIVLAPELVKWDITGIVGDADEKLETLQRRVCFTELSAAELSQHSITFGPIALAFSIERLRTAGATPVVYVPQGFQSNPLSLLAIFLVRGAHHTRYVLNQLNDIAQGADRDKLQAKLGLPVSKDYTLNLRNTGKAGEVVADYPVPAAHIHQLMKHVGFNNTLIGPACGNLREAAPEASRRACINIPGAKGTIRANCGLSYEHSHRRRLLGSGRSLVFPPREGIPRCHLRWTAPARCRL